MKRKLFFTAHCPVIWFYGLSGAGKSTLAQALSEQLNAMHIANFLLDGDDLRGGLNENLGFSNSDREENLRRAAHCARLFQRSGIVTIASFISPTAASRKLISEIIVSDFYDVYVEASLKTCENRDVKGHYKKARAGKIPEFTGISAPFEVPEHPFLTLTTDNQSIETCSEMLMEALKKPLGLDAILKSAVI